MYARSTAKSRLGGPTLRSWNDGIELSAREPDPERTCSGSFFFTSISSESARRNHTGREVAVKGAQSMTAKLLVVEDSRYQRLASRHILSEAGFSVVEASDGEEALRQVWESHPDLIILDMLLPQLGGEQVLQALRQDPATSRIPVIVVSSLPQSNADRLKEAGAK